MDDLGREKGGGPFVAQKAIREQKGGSEAARSNNVDVSFGVFLDKLLAVQSFLIAILAALFTIEHLLAVIVLVVTYDESSEFNDYQGCSSHL